MVFHVFPLCRTSTGPALGEHRVILLFGLSELLLPDLVLDQLFPLCVHLEAQQWAGQVAWGLT